MNSLFLKIITAFFPPIFLYLFQYIVGGIFGLYSVWPGFDNPMHFFGGVAMGMTGIFLIQIAQKENWLLIKSKLITIFIAVCFVAFMATLWEFHEFLMDHYLGTRTQPSIFDIMKDMFLGLAGGLLISILMVFSSAKKSI